MAWERIFASRLIWPQVRFKRGEVKNVFLAKPMYEGELESLEKLARSRESRKFLWKFVRGKCPDKYFHVCVIKKLSKIYVNVWDFLSYTSMCLNTICKMSSITSILSGQAAGNSHLWQKIHQSTSSKVYGKASRYTNFGKAFVAESSSFFLSQALTCKNSKLAQKRIQKYIKIQKHCFHIFNKMQKSETLGWLFSFCLHIFASNTKMRDFGASPTLQVTEMVV